MLEQKGELVVSSIVEDLRDDLSITKTLQKRFGQSLKDFQDSWKKYALKKKFNIIPGITALRFNFKKDRNQSKEDKKQEYSRSECQNDHTEEFWKKKTKIRPHRGGTNVTQQHPHRGFSAEKKGRPHSDPVHTPGIFGKQSANAQKELIRGQ